MYALILQEEELLDQTDLSSVRNCSMGSAPASDNLLDTLAKRFPDAKLNLNYGITEGGPILFAWTHPEGLPRPRTSVGFPIDGVDIRLVDGPDENQGVLHVKSPGVMKGYHNLPDATEKVLTADGWMDTGDILRRDEIGWYFFVDRADDMFVCMVRISTRAMKPRWNATTKLCRRWLFRREHSESPRAIRGS